MRQNTQRVLTAIPYGKTVDDIEALLPWNIKKQIERELQGR